MSPSFSCLNIGLIDTSVQILGAMGSPASEESIYRPRGKATVELLRDGVLWLYSQVCIEMGQWILQLL